MEPLKHCYNREYLDDLAHRIHQHYPPFPIGEFLKIVMDKDWEARELKERMRHVSLSLHQSMALPYPEAIEVLKKAIYPDNGLPNLVFPDYVEVFGLEAPALSLEALGHFTEFASAEFAIRPFIIRYEEQTMAQMRSWSQDANHHRRRLASEGCRPRLPWAMALPRFKKDPTPILPILEKLHSDESEYVRRSVANNLNDISKDHPELALHLGRKWLGESKQSKRLVKHGLRTLLKAAHPEALSLFGFAPLDHVSVNNLSLRPMSLVIGEDLFFDFELVNRGKKTAKVRLEYAIDFVKKNGKSSRKIFQLSEKDFAPGSHKVQRKQSFRDLTTRKHYPGPHQLSILVNGREKARQAFDLNAG